MSNQRDRQAVHVFLAWYNSTHNANYHELLLGNKVFDLRGGDWDFIATGEPVDAWLAIEVKEIAIADSRKITALWKTVFAHVVKDVHHIPKGTYWVIHVPRLYGQIRQKYLEEAVCVALSELKTDLEVAKPGDEIEIWAIARKRLQRWPLRNLYGETKRLTLLKKSYYGQCIRWVGGPSYLSNLEKLERHAVEELFQVRNGRIKANTQLGIAKKHGAKETIWVIRGIVEYIDYLRDSLVGTDVELLSNIDMICLVDLGLQKVIMVWESGQVVKD